MISAAGQTALRAAGPELPRLRAAALPRYPAIAETAHITGKIVVQVTVKNGRVVKAEVQSGKPYLNQPTVANLKTWLFDTRVNTIFSVTYTYEISGSETTELTNAKVEMLPSLDVTVTARPVKPTCSDCR
jgi:outer membrane biosynthesis protein TonB